MATAAISAPAVKKEKAAGIPVTARFLRVTHLLFLLLIGVQFIPDHASVTESHTNWLNLFLDSIGFIYGFLTLWTILTAKTALLPAALFPPFGKVLAQFAEDAPKIAVNIKSSVGIILQGFILALVTAIPLGLILGWNARLGGAATYLSKFFSSIPPIVYIPYGIALLPSFRSVSVFVIFLASFWPVFAGTMSGVLHVDSRILDSAKVLNVSKPTMLLSVILPASLNQIFLGCNQGLSVSFILLTSAEMIGARDGMGYYVKYYSDFGDYTRTIVGLLVIGIVVIGVTFLVNSLQKYLLRWKK